MESESSRLTLIGRERAAAFWRLVDVGEPASCWRWDGRLDVNGYGRLGWGKNSISPLAHRLAYELHRGVVLPRELIVSAKGIIVRHRCDNPPCCNPFHLQIGTPSDNARDRAERGRGARGSKQGSSKLQESDIPVIRRLVAAGAFKSAVSKEFGVSHETISQIVRREKWAHVA